MKTCPYCSSRFDPNKHRPQQVYCGRPCADAARRTLSRESSPHWQGGKTFHSLYGTYREMIRRCSVPSAADWPKYGARGITVCARWRDDFWNFVADMGERPPGHSIDRIDNDGPYTPENCRWADAATQRRNQRPRTRRKTCKAGHPMVEGSFYVVNASGRANPKRICRTCNLASQRAQRERRKVGAA